MITHRNNHGVVGGLTFSFGYVDTAVGNVFVQTSVKQSHVSEVSGQRPVIQGYWSVPFFLQCGEAGAIDSVQRG